MKQIPENNNFFIKENITLDKVKNCFFFIIFVGRLSDFLQVGNSIKRLHIKAKIN